MRSSLLPNGTTLPDTQATLVRALAFGLVPEHLRACAADRLADRIARTVLPDNLGL
jgi:alpha-L-rhamnosidase